MKITEMSLDDLREAVSKKREEAEQLATGTPEANKAWKEVSDIEQQIAEHLKPHAFEGKYARIEAVRALLNAGDTQGAGRLIQHYETEAACK